MSNWLPLLVPLAVSVGIIAVLGLPAVFALRLRGFAALIVVVPAAFAVLSLSSVIAPIVGVSWSIASPLALAVVLALVLFALSRWLRPAYATPSRPHRLWMPLASAAIGGAAIAVTLILSMKTADAVSQTYDANFHLNAVRQILDTGSASPFDMDLAVPGKSVFYPTLWHATVALIVQLSGTTIPIATNALVFAVSAVVWPIGAVALGRAIAGPSTRSTVVAGILSAAFPSFPLVFAGYGVLYPNLLATALLPFALFAFLQLTGIAAARRSDPLNAVVGWLLVLAALGATVLAQPNALYAFLLWIIFPVIYIAVRIVRGSAVSSRSGLLVARTRPLSARVAIAVFAVAVLAGGIVGAWTVGRTTDNTWQGKREPFSAIIDVLGSTPRLEGHAWPVSILVIFGAVLAWRRPGLRWALGTATVLAATYVVANGFDTSDWRTLLLGPWYNDPWRLASLVSVGALPLAVLGASSLSALFVAGLQRVVRTLPTGNPKRTMVGFIIVGVAFLLAATQGAGAYAGVQYVSKKYVSSEKSPLLSPNELALLKRLPDSVPKDAVIANNPWNGGALAYAIADRHVLVPHTGGTYDARITEMTQSLADGDIESCRLASELDVRFVLDFGTRFVFKDTPRAEPFEGITDVESSDVFTEVDREGDAVLYEITGCGI